MSLKTNRTIRKALVTGGAGFVGSHLIERLLKDKVQVISFDDYSAGKTENLDKFRDDKNFFEVRGDVSNIDEVRKAMQGVDTVFHQAASKKTICMRDPSRDLEVNGGGALCLLRAANESGVEKFVHASTGSVYGEALYFPQDEKHSVRPVSYYGVSKLAGESYVNTFAKLYGLDTTILRYFHIYGPRQESTDVGGVVSIFLRRAIQGQPLIIHGDGNQMRTFTWVGDVVEANIQSAIRPIASGKTYNCASGIQVTVNELAKMVLDFVKSSSEIVYVEPLLGDIRKFDVDNRLITNELCLDFQQNFRAGLSQTLSWALDSFSRDLK